MQELAGVGRQELGALTALAGRSWLHWVAGAGWQELGALGALTALAAELAAQKLTFRPLPIKPHVFFIGKG